MRFVTSAAMLFLLVGLVGCAHTPDPSGYPYSQEQNMQSVYHWQVLAREVVATQVLPVAKVADDPSTESIVSVPVYVDESDQTEFGKVFREYLITDLHKNGIHPSTTPYDAVVVKWGTRLVWNDKEGRSFYGLPMGVLGLAKWILVGDASPNASVIELIVTTQIEKAEVILSRETHNFYIDDGNKENFRKPEAVAGNTGTMGTMAIP